MKTDLFVYYRALSTDAAAVEQAVGRMQAALGRPGSLHRRPELKDGMHTWMEIYPAVPEGFDARLARAVDKAGLAGMIIGGRHHEVFLEVSSCA